MYKLNLTLVFPRTILKITNVGTDDSHTAFNWAVAVPHHLWESGILYGSASKPFESKRAALCIASNHAANDVLDLAKSLDIIPTLYSVEESFKVIMSEGNLTMDALLIGTNPLLYFHLNPTAMETILELSDGIWSIADLNKPEMLFLDECVDKFDSVLSSRQSQALRDFI